MSNLGKYMMWSSTDGSMTWIYLVSLTTRTAYLIMNSGIKLLYIIGTDREFLNTIT